MAFLKRWRPDCVRAVFWHFLNVAPSPYNVCYYKMYSFHQFLGGSVPFDWQNDATAWHFGWCIRLQHFVLELVQREWHFVALSKPKNGILGREKFGNSVKSRDVKKTAISRRLKSVFS